MEKLRKSAVWLGVSFVIVGLAIQLAPKAAATPGHTESWMESSLPKQIGKFTMVYSDGGTEQTYKMPESTYNELVPYGIVCRVYRAGEDVIDVVVISSNKKESFHDPKVCFTAQGWTFGTLNEEPIKTSKGDIRATVASMSNQDGRTSQTIFFYKDADNYYAAPQGMTFNMLKRRLLFKPNSDGVFYRFIGVSPSVTKEKLQAFISDYLAESERTSDGKL
ncbi:MAG: exosortase-associated EpsI family protein [Fimbriimonadaceae bacterium]|nr:exosortase-associated EpsI family protein [Fimbriimonadaceae bacterium]